MSTINLLDHEDSINTVRGVLGVCRAACCSGGLSTEDTVRMFYALRTAEDILDKMFGEVGAA